MAPSSGLIDRAGVTGSIPVAPTNFKPIDLLADVAELLERDQHAMRREIRRQFAGIDHDLGVCGTSYGSSMPVKPLSMPARAFA